MLPRALRRIANGNIRQSDQRPQQLGPLTKQAVRPHNSGMVNQGSNRPVLFWGVIVFGMMLLCSGILFAIMWPQLSGKLGGMEKGECQRNLNDIYKAFSLYQDDNVGYLPTAGNWMDLIEPQMSRKKRLRDPAYEDDDRKFGYAYNSRIAGQKGRKLENPGKTELVYDSMNLSRNASDEGTSIPRKGRHKDEGIRGNNVLFAGGAVKFLTGKK
jgi:hypothetical protein